MRHLLTAVLIACALPAAAQQACAPRAEIVSYLRKQYDETRRGIGLMTGGTVAEVFASASTGTWTIIVTRPDGVACAVAAGEAWQDTMPELPGEDG